MTRSALITLLGFIALLIVACDPAAPQDTSSTALDLNAAVTEDPSANAADPALQMSNASGEEGEEGEDEYGEEEAEEDEMDEDEDPEGEDEDEDQAEED